MSLINIYFLPEAEIYCHNVSQKLIMLVREFRVSSLNDYIYFMKYSSNLVLCECDIFGTRRMNSCKIGPNGDIHYFEGEEVPLRYIFTQRSAFDSIPLIGFYQQTKLSKRTMWDVEL